MDLSLDDTLCQIVALPELPLLVYSTINRGLYGEPGFSDFTPSDLAAEFKGDTELVGFALTILKNAGLVWVENTDVNGFPYHFIHTFAHDEGWVKKGLVVGPHHRGF